MSRDYWEEWNPDLEKIFSQVDKACAVFLYGRKEWSLVKTRWDNPDRMLSGPTADGFWGNIHVLAIPEHSRFRFSYAIWSDKDQGSYFIDNSHRVRAIIRFWATSDDGGIGDQFLLFNEATETAVKQMLEGAWNGLLKLPKQGKFREEKIELPLP